MDIKEGIESDIDTKDKVGRCKSIFWQHAPIFAIYRKGNLLQPSDSTGKIDPIIKPALEKLEPNMNCYNIFNEVLLWGRIWIHAYQNY